MRDFLLAGPMAIVKFDKLFPTYHEMFANQINCQSLILKTKVKVKKEKSGTCAIRLEMFESILVNSVIILATKQLRLNAKT